MNAKCFWNQASGNRRVDLCNEPNFIHRSNAIAIYEASKMSENHWNPQSQSRSGHDWTPMQRLVHTRCLVIQTTLLVIVRRALNTSSYLGTSAASVHDGLWSHACNNVFISQISIDFPQNCVFKHFKPVKLIWSFLFQACERPFDSKDNVRSMSMDTTVGCENESKQWQLKARWELFIGAMEKSEVRENWKDKINIKFKRGSRSA